MFDSPCWSAARSHTSNVPGRGQEYASADHRLLCGVKENPFSHTALNKPRTFLVTAQRHRGKPGEISDSVIPLRLSDLVRDPFTGSAHRLSVGAALFFCIFRRVEASGLKKQYAIGMPSPHKRAGARLRFNRKIRATSNHL
jgi:hypothetical protein